MTTRFVICIVGSWLEELALKLVYLSCYDWWFTFATISVEVCFSKNSSLFTGSLLPCAV